MQYNFVTPNNNQKEPESLLSRLAGPLATGVGGFLLGQMLSGSKEKSEVNLRLERELKQANADIEALNKQVKQLQENLAKVTQVAAQLKSRQTPDTSPIPQPAVPVYKRSYQLN